MPAARKNTKSAASLNKKINTMLSIGWKNFLLSKGDVLLTANPVNVGKGWTVVLVNFSRFGLGKRYFTKRIQRSFRVGEPTKVPAVLAHAFLEDKQVIEWQESIKVVDNDSILDAEVIL